MNLCRESLRKKLKGLSSTPKSMCLNGPADACFYTAYYFECKLEVDGESYNIEMLTISNSAICYDIILGRPLFQTRAELKVSPQSVTITHVDIARQLMNLNTNNNELDVGVRAYSTAVEN